MKRTIWLLLVLFIASLAIVGCGSEDSAKDTKTVETKKEATAIVSVMYEDEYSPYSFTEGGQAKGMNVDILKEAFKRAGLEVKFSTAPWKRVQQMVEDGEADAFITPYKTAEREAKYFYPAVALDKEETVWVVKKDSNFAFDGDLAKLTNNQLTYFRGYPPLSKNEAMLKTLKIEEADNISEALNKLLAGRTDAVANDKFVLMSVIKKLGKLEDVKFITPAIKADDGYIIYTKKKDMKDVAAKIDKAITDMHKDGAYQKIVDQYTK